jgi:membrane-bound lytic murein transglycosylase D
MLCMIVARGVVLLVLVRYYTGMEILHGRLKLIVLALLSLCFSLFIFATNYNATSLLNRVSSNVIVKLTAVANSSETISSLVQPHSIWKSLRNNFELDHRAQSAPVQAQIRAFVADKEKLYKILRASAPYIYFIHQQVEAHNLPAEIALIPVIESEFNPYDHSNKGAAGLWQLMPQTARDLGVDVRKSYDGRRNVVNSTNAALNYFSDLNHLFKGNWYLALAAYNSGEMKVLRAQKRAGSHNFWNLQLPHETKVYVPKLLAIAEIIEHPEKYGIDLPTVYSTPYFQSVTILKPISLAKLAEVSSIDQNLLETLNPDYRKGLPARHGSTFLLPVARSPQSRTDLREYFSA